MLSTETLHKEVVYCCQDLVRRGFTWSEVESYVWMQYGYYAITYASEINRWIEEAHEQTKVLQA